MRVVIDMQAAQAGLGASGRFAEAVARALIAAPCGHEVVLSLSTAFPEATVRLREAFAPSLPPAAFALWHGAQKASERIRAAHLAALQPDVLVLSAVPSAHAGAITGSLPRTIGAPPVLFLCAEGEAVAAPAELSAPALLELHGAAALLTADAAGAAALAEAGLIMPVLAGTPWEAVEEAARLGRAGWRRKPKLAVLSPLGDDPEALGRALTGWSRDYAVTLVSADGAPVSSALAAFPPARPEAVEALEPERMLLLPGDDPHHLAIALQLTFGFPAIMTAPPAPVAALLQQAVGTDVARLFRSLLLDTHGWQALTAGEHWPELAARFPLEDTLRTRLVALLPAGDRLDAAQIEAAYAASPFAAKESCMAELVGTAEPELVARAVAATFPHPRLRTLFLDVTTLAMIDAGTGIQRVVREITGHLGRAAGLTARVEPVQSRGGPVTLARDYASRLYQTLDVSGDGLPAHVHQGDVYVRLDLDMFDHEATRQALLAVRAAGGLAAVVVYDLLPVLQAQHFVERVRVAFPLWLELIATHADALLCISRTVADELIAFLDERQPERRQPLKIGWFHLGADFAAESAAPAPAARPELLMVGTVEGRKGHVEALDALEALWRRGVDAGLVIVGRAGWHTEALQARLRGHAERGRRLRWLEDADDATVASLYRSCAGLLMASEGEGFGLPLVEASHAGLPVIARNLPVFREICGEGALYFDAGDLAETVERWLLLRAEGKLPDPARITALTWAEASRRMADMVLDGTWYREWSGSARVLEATRSEERLG